VTSEGVLGRRARLVLAPIGRLANLGLSEVGRVAYEVIGSLRPQSLAIRGISGVVKRLMFRVASNPHTPSVSHCCGGLLPRGLS
jgi:hypothetical protein